MKAQIVMRALLWNQSEIVKVFVDKEDAETFAVRQKETADSVAGYIYWVEEWDME